MMQDRHRMWRCGAAAMVAACAGAVASPASAVNFIWNNSTGGDFLDPANWAQTGDDDGIPDANDGVFFNEASNLNGTVTFSSDVTVSAIQFRSDTGVITFDIGAGKTFTVTGNPILGSDSDLAQLEIVSGTMSTGLFIINASQNNNDNNKLTVKNAGTVLDVRSTGFRVGGNGSSGNVATISDGASLINAGTIFVGLQGADNSLFTVTGAGSSVSGATGVTVGGNATTPGNPSTNNHLQVLAGASFVARTLGLGVGGDPNTGGLAATENYVTVSGAGSTFTLNNEGDSTYSLDIGRRWANNTLLVEDGAVFNVASGRIAIGREANAGNNNLLHVDGAVFTHSDATQGIEVRRGTLRVSNGGAVTSSVVLLYEDGVLEGNGTITANVAAPTETVVDPETSEEITTLLPGGLADIGLSIGQINVVGNWDNTNLEILLEVADLSASPVAGTDYDLLDITGQFTHGGSIVIDVTDLVGSEVVKLIGWSSMTGSAGNTSVSFIGGPAVDYAFQSDGLYLNMIPEPASLALLAAGALVAALRRRA